MPKSNFMINDVYMLLGFEEVLESKRTFSKSSMGFVKS
jgi:hypothetical protein